jgi:hypothetical protein
MEALMTIVIHRPFRVMFSICCTRVVLGIRGAYVTLHESSRDDMGRQENQSFGLVSLSETR